MTKKEYIFKVLDKLSEYRPIARWLKVLLNQDRLDDKQISWLLTIFENTIKEVSDKTKKDKLQKSMDAIKKFQSLEKEQEKKDAKDIQELDKMLENI